MIRVSKGLGEDEGYETESYYFNIGVAPFVCVYLRRLSEIDTVLGLVKDARPYFSAEEDQVIRIISEEAAAYYSGQKSPEEVTRVIQNRVQLYVNENM